MKTLIEHCNLLDGISDTIAEDAWLLIDRNYSAPLYLSDTNRGTEHP